MFWTSSQPPSAPARDAPAAPTAKVFSLSHMHVHYAEQFIGAIELAMQLPISSIRVSLYSLENRDADNVLVTVAAVLHMAKIMSTFASMQTFYTDKDMSGLVLVHEVGRAEHTLRPKVRWGRQAPPDPRLGWRCGGGRYCQIAQRLGAELEFHGGDPGVDPDHFQFRP